MVCNFREEWDGSALIERNGVKYINEPHAGGGNPVFAIGGKDTEATETIFYRHAWDKLRQDRRERIFCY